MISYKFLQYNTDNLRLGWPILEKLAGSSDFLLLQRFPKSKQKELCNITGKAFLTESVMHKDLSLAIGRANGLSSVGGIETINLPSSQLIQAVGNEWQGCTALKGLYNNIRLVSALPCYPEAMGEFPITKEDNEKDSYQEAREAANKAEDEQAKEASMQNVEKAAENAEEINEENK